MLKPVPMAKVAVVGPKDRMATTIENLHDLNLLHVEDYTPGDDDAFDLGSPLEHGNLVSERLLRLRGVLKGAGIQAPTEARPFTADNVQALQERLAEVEGELGRLVESRSQVVDQIKEVDEEEHLLARVRNLPIRLELLHGFQNVVVFTGFVPAQADLSKILQADAQAEVMTQPEEEGLFVAVFARKDNEKAVAEKLAQLRYAPLELPEAEGTVAARLGVLDTKRRELKGRQAEVEAKIQAIDERHAAALHALDESLTIEADKATAPVRFRTTENSFMIEGWVPAHRLDALTRSLAKATGDKVYVAQLGAPSPGGSAHGADVHEAEHHGSPEDEEGPPVKLHNKGAPGSYELVTDTYSRPKYREVDPTQFLFWGFPFMYGFMLGDIAYGIILVLLIKGGIFTKAFNFFGFESKKQLNRILTHSAIWSIIFGVIYAEFFGMELFGHEGILFGDHGYFGHAEDMPVLGHAAWYPVARFVFVPQLLIATVVIGVIHMLVGLGLGFRNAYVAHGLKDALGHRGSWLAILLSFAFIGLAFVLGSPALWIGFVLFVVGVILLLMGEGALGLMEIPTLVSNVVSYTRLVAIGLSSAGIALAGNKVAGLAFGSGGVMILAGIVVLALFHGMNIALGVIGPSLHSLRLHYVEFFTKFYEGGGTPYEPFGFERKHTKKEVKTA